jgi:1-deoxy-D-xylulose-5-phosphate reductoisomerase
VVLHPQSIVHSMVELCDNSVIPQICQTDMRFAIQYALTWPERFDGALPAMDFEKLLTLEFSAPDRKKYPSIGFAEEAMRQGGTMPAVMNAANEAAVERFRREEIRFIQIWSIVEKTMNTQRWSLSIPNAIPVFSA